MPDPRATILQVAFVLLVVSFAVHLAARWLAPAVPLLVVLNVLAVLVIIWRLFWQRWR